MLYLFKERKKKKKSEIKRRNKFLKEKKIEKKNMDYIILNSLKDKGAGFGYDTNKITLLSRNGEKKAFGLKPKNEVAKDIVEHTLIPFFEEKKETES